MWLSVRIILLCFVLISLQISVADNAPKVTSPSGKSPPKDPSNTNDSTDDDDEENAPSRSAIPLTSMNFAKQVGDGNVWLIEFYSNSCGHCREFARSYDNIAANFHIPSDQGFRVGKVDCVAERALNARFGIQYLPTFFVIDGWSVYQFDEPRSESSLIDFLRGGYKKQSPMPLFSSPMGPMGLLQGTLMYVGSLLTYVFDKVQNSGVPPLIGGIVLSFVAVVTGMFSVLILAIITTPKSKVD